jgi:molybdate transport system substrate-binding protein
LAFALSLAVAPKLKENGRYELVPTSDYPPIEQAAVIIKSSKKKATAEQFLAYIKKPEIVSLTRDYGFVVPDSAAGAN